MVHCCHWCYAIFFVCVLATGDVEANCIHEFMDTWEKFFTHLSFLINKWENNDVQQLENFYIQLENCSGEFPSTQCALVMGDTDTRVFDT